MDLVALPPTVLAALVGGDLPGAGVLLGRELPGYFAESELRHVWRLRRDQLTSDPASATWSIHVAVTDGVAVGHGGFHGPPDDSGTVEVGYSVDPACWRRGHGKAILRELLRRAAAAPDVVRVAERGRELVFETLVP
ncbi:GNAT family N-acetyltransferase [Spirillospora sp. NBC_00431]